MHQTDRQTDTQTNRGWREWLMTISRFHRLPGRVGCRWVGTHGEQSASAARDHTLELRLHQLLSQLITFSPAETSCWAWIVTWNVVKSVDSKLPTRHLYAKYPKPLSPHLGIFPKILWVGASTLDCAHCTVSHHFTRVRTEDSWCWLWTTSGPP